MSFESYVRYKEQAEEHRESRDFDGAGTNYTLAAYESLGKSGYRGTADISRGIYCLLSSSLCFKLANRDDRCRNRSQQGILLAEDLRDNVFEDKRLVAAMWESIGDFQIIGDIPGAEEAYENAQRHYSTAGDPKEYQCEEWIDAAINIFHRTTASTGRETSWSPWQSTQTERIEAKRHHFSSVVREIVNQSSWEWDA